VFFIYERWKNWGFTNESEQLKNKGSLLNRYLVYSTQKPMLSVRNEKLKMVW
jgi:hypothetical protein